jgi:hypothetical protein
VAALVGAWIFGATTMQEGCGEVTYYKTADHAELAQSAAQEVAHEVDPAAVVQVHERYYSALDAAKTRMFPLAVAALLLGAAMWTLAAFAMLGKNGARAALLQILAVHGALIVLKLAITADVRAAEAEANSRLAALTPVPRAGPVRAGRTFLIEHSGVIPLVQKSARLMGYALVIVALTRRRTRDFFEAQGAARAEP